MKEDIYIQVRNNSFNIAYFMTKNYHDAEDIAQNVCLKFLMNESTIEYPLAWSRTVTKNEVYRIQKAKGKDTLCLPKEEIEKYESEISKSITLTEKRSKNITLKEAKELLSKDDYFYFKLWIKNQFNVSQIAKCHHITYYSAQSRIQRMKRNLKAAKLNKIGYMVSPDILDYRKYQNIKYFMKRFKEAIKTKSIHDLKYYFPKEFYQKMKEVDLYDYKKYKIQRKDDKIYEISIFFMTSEKKLSVCFIEIMIDKRNRIKVVKFKPKPIKIVEVLNSKEFMKKIPPLNEKGLIPLPGKEIDALVKKHNAKYKNDK